MIVQLHAVPHLVLMMGLSESLRASTVELLLQHTVQATTLAQAEGLVLDWHRLRVTEVAEVPALAPGWFLPWSRAYGWYDAQRAHLAATVDVFFGRQIVAGTAFLGYAPRNAGWCVVDTRAPVELILHELGHALGLRRHRDDPGNIMFPRTTGSPQHFDAGQLLVMGRSRWATWA